MQITSSVPRIRCRQRLSQDFCGSAPNVKTFEPAFLAHAIHYTSSVDTIFHSSMSRMGAAQWNFVGSTIVYQSLHGLLLLIVPTNSTFVRIAQSREAISILHCSLQTVLSLICLRQNSDSLTTTVSRRWSGTSVDSEVFLIATKSEFANCITAIETGYLLQDTIVLLQAFRQRRQDGPLSSGNSQKSQRVKGWSLAHLGLHHAILGSLLLILQYYIARDWEKGILVIVVLHLMNASSIFGTARWFLINFCPYRKRLILMLSVVYLATFATCRIYIFYWILNVFGKQLGISTWAAVARLRVPCKIGTCTLVLINTVWLAIGVKKMASNIVSRREGTCFAVAQTTFGS